MIAVLLAGVAGCVPPDPAFLRHPIHVGPDAPGGSDPMPAAPRTRNVVLVTIDGVRWQDVFGYADWKRVRKGPDAPATIADLLPNIHRRLIPRGVALGAERAGEPVLAAEPSFYSLPGYLEILTGRHTACRDNHCPAHRGTTLFDDLRAQLDVSPSQIAVIASWPELQRVVAGAPAGTTVSAGRHGGNLRGNLRVNECAARTLDEAERAFAAPGWGDYRPDAYTAHLALEYLIEARPRLLHVALGDTDEYAHRLSYRGYIDALVAADRFIGQLLDVLDHLGRYGAETTVIVTTDHGRSSMFHDHGAHAPESGRVFVLAAGGAVPVRGAVPVARTRHLRDIAPTVRALLGLNADYSALAGAAIPELLPTNAQVLVGAR